jgi:hypothetical protein
MFQSAIDAGQGRNPLHCSDSEVEASKIEAASHDRDPNLGNRPQSPNLHRKMRERMTSVFSLPVWQPKKTRPTQVVVKIFPKMQAHALAQFSDKLTSRFGHKNWVLIPWHYLLLCTEPTVLPNIYHIAPSISQQQPHDDDLTPLVRINQHSTQLSIVRMDQVQPVWTNFIERHDYAPDCER